MSQFENNLITSWSESVTIWCHRSINPISCFKVVSHRAASVRRLVEDLKLKEKYVKFLLQSHLTQVLAISKKKGSVLHIQAFFILNHGRVLCVRLAYSSSALETSWKHLKYNSGGFTKSWWLCDYFEKKIEQFFLNMFKSEATELRASATHARKLRTHAEVIRHPEDFINVVSKPQYSEMPPLHYSNFLTHRN